LTGKKEASRTQPPLDELIGNAPPPADLVRMARKLVDDRTGVVSQFGPRAVIEGGQGAHALNP